VLIFVAARSLLDRARRKRARRSPTPRGIKRVTLVIHGKEDGRDTTAFVRECEEIGQIKPRMIEK
jgi:hypothetical protein